MWEARAEPAGLADLISWVCDTALPELEQNPLHISSEVYSSADQRLVVVSKWRSCPVPMPEPPPLLVARAPRSWDFTAIDR
jgi:hypothetical protein